MILKAAGILQASNILDFGMLAPAFSESPLYIFAVYKVNLNVVDYITELFFTADNGNKYSV